MERLGEKSDGDFPDDPTSCIDLRFVQRYLPVLGLQRFAEHIGPASGREQRQTTEDTLAQRPISLHVPLEELVGLLRNINGPFRNAIPLEEIDALFDVAEEFFRVAAVKSIDDLVGR